MLLTRPAAITIAAAFSILLTTVCPAADELDESAQQQQILGSQLKALSDVISPELRQALAESQRLWLAHRDQSCAFQRQFADQYARSRQAATNCISNMNHQRLQELQSYLNRLMKAESAAQRSGATGAPSRSCRLAGLPEKFEVLAVGTHTGLTLADVKIGDSTKDVHEAPVVVNQPDVPVVLVLSAYNATVWRVSRTPQTHIAAVIVGGYHRQIVLGVEKATPKLFAVRDDDSECGYFLAEGAAPRLLQANARIQDMTGGRAIDRLVSKPTGGRFVVGTEPGADDDRLISSDEMTLQDYAGAKIALAGDRGLEQLVARGKLRKATAEDVAAWIEKASAPYRTLDPTLTVRHRIPLERAYVVLAPVDLPAGLHGSTSSYFIVPENVPPPNGAFGSWVYLMSTGECLMHGTSPC